MAPKLDRIPFHDPRSRNYPVRALLPRHLERKRTIWGLPGGFPIDQGQEGACVGFGYSGELAADPVVIPGVDSAFAQHLYQLAQAEDRRMGNDWPEGASMLAGAKAAKNAGWISSYRWAFGIDDVIDTICALGPVVLGINWRNSMYDTRPDGLVVVDGPVVGGHCIAAIGYIPDHPQWGEVIIWMNSWGRSYGIEGVGYIHVDDLRDLLADQGEAAIVVDAQPLTPEPGPLYVASRRSKCFHVKGAHWWLAETRAWSARADALAVGLRPCSWCKP